MTCFFRIGGIAIELSSLDPRIALDFAYPLSLFLTGSTEPDLRIEARVMGQYLPPTGPLVFDSGAVWKLYEDHHGYRLECSSEVFGELPYKILQVDREFRHATVEVRVIGDHVPAPISFPIDEMLVNALLTQRSGIEFHSCGVIDSNGNGLLFAGNSGGGKTTTARLWITEGAEIVSDDRVIVRRELGQWWMYGTPWHGEAEICSPSRAPLRQLFLLQQATENATCAIAPSAAVARLLACAFPPFHDRTGLASILSTLDILVSEVPISTLEFRNDRSAVTFVSAISQPSASALHPAGSQ